MIRSILSVVVGYAIWTALWLTSNAVIGALTPGSIAPDGSIANPAVLGTLLALSFIISVLSGLSTAIIAKRKAVAHALVLGIALLATGIPIQLGYWDKMPVWYHLIFLTLLVPASIVGGAFCRR